jgi:hypothetical protein
MSDLVKLDGRGLQVAPETVDAPVPLPPVKAVDWRSVREAAHERFTAESRVANGAQITERAQEGLARIRRRMEASGSTADELEVMLLSSYGFGAAQLIHDYMSRR